VFLGADEIAAREQRAADRPVADDDGLVTLPNIQDVRRASRTEVYEVNPADVAAALRDALPHAMRSAIADAVGTELGRRRGRVD